ncbi:MAG: SusD/RagB family nutrient-binding outer membrane lipoprotein, partial [Mucilaginibacter sp.]
NGNEALSGNPDSSLQIGMPNGYDLLGGATDISKSPGYPGGTGTGADFAPLGRYSRPRTSMYLKLGGPIFILTYPETELLLAEAAVRGWNVGGSAQQHYANGVSGALQSLTQLDPQTVIDPADINNYLTDHPIDISSEASALQMINTQYWLVTGTTFDFIENWFNWRRSGYPVLTPINYPGNVTNGTIPRRMIYLSTEVLTNPVNYQAAVARLAGGDKLTSRVWWDVAQ